MQWRRLSEMMGYWKCIMGKFLPCVTYMYFTFIMEQVSCSCDLHSSRNEVVNFLGQEVIFGLTLLMYSMILLS